MINYHNFLVTVVAQCPIALPQHASAADVCKTYRDDTLAREKLYYKVNDPSLTDFSYPRLNQSASVMSTRVAFDNEVASIFASRNMIKAIGYSTAVDLAKTLGNEPMKTYKEYQSVYNIFVEAIKVQSSLLNDYFPH